MARLVPVVFINGHGWKYWISGQTAMIEDWRAKEFHAAGKVKYVGEEEKTEATEADAFQEDIRTPVDRAMHSSPVVPTIRAQDYSTRQLAEVIQDMNSIAELKHFLTSEMTNTEYPGGRTTALNAIKKRLEQLRNTSGDS